MNKTFTLRQIANFTLFIIIAGSLAVGTSLVLLLRDYKNMIYHQHLIKSAYESLFVLKYDTERLLTTIDLDSQKKTLFDSQNEFERNFKTLTPYIREKKEWFEFKSIIFNELAKIETVLQDDVFSKQNMMEKSLLRRLGEGLNANENSLYYIKIRDLNNNIAFMKQYEDFLLDELSEFNRITTQEADIRVEKTKKIIIFILAITFFLFIVFAYLASRAIKKEESKLLGIQGNLKNALSDLKDKQEILVEQRDILDHYAHYDQLTNIPNRRHFVEQLRGLISKYATSAEPFAVWFIDLDRFKEVNDSFGHSVGDSVLVEVARRLKKTAGIDSVARFGGDEFAIVVHNAYEHQSSEDIISHFMDLLIEPINANGYEIFITCSAGASFYPNDASNVEELLRNADSAMYEAKDNGKNTYQFYTYQMTQKILERISIETNLRKAMSNNEFFLHYQPQVDLAQNKIVGCEALIRWNNSSLGMVSPDRFIPIAEETGLILEIGEWVLEEACRQIIAWKRGGVEMGYVAVNLSSKQIMHGHLDKTIPAILEKYGCVPNQIELEITESILMQDPEYSKTLLTNFSERGFKLAIDDFGTGYSSLSYLKHLPINKLKIDKSFVDNLPYDQADCEIVKSTIHLCKGLNLDIIAEGIEKKVQADYLQEEGCTFAQGYLFFKPMSADQITIRST